MADGLEQLLKYQDVLFHGSPCASIKTLEPRPAKDLDKTNTFNTDLAVFASSNVCFSIIFGLVDSNKLKNECGFGWSVGSMHDENNQVNVISEIPKQAKEFVENAIGYVYVLPKDNFKESSSFQHKSKLPVTPLERIEIKLQDFYDAGGIIDWTDGDPNIAFYKNDLAL